VASKRSQSRAAGPPSIQTNSKTDIDQSAPGAPLHVEVDPEDSLGSDFEDLFGDGSESVIVELIRVDPRFFGGRRVGGFLCHLPPGSTKETIREGYGGGQYRLIKKGAGGKIVDQRSVAIAGDPFLPSTPETGTAPAAAVPEVVRSPLAPVTTKEGIPIGIDNAAFLAMAQQLALVRSMFPDINSELMKAVLTRAEPNPAPNLLGTAGEIIQLVNQFRELVPATAPAEGGSGAGWMDLVREGLQAFGAYMKAQQRPPVPALPRPISRPELGAPPVLPPVSLPAPLDNPNGPHPESESPKMSIQDFVNQSIVVICNGFVMKKSAADVVAALNLSIPLPVSARSAMLEPQRKSFKDLCEVNLSDDFADNPELEGQFSQFFDQVFDGFIDKGNG